MSGRAESEYEIPAAWPGPGSEEERLEGATPVVRHFALSLERLVRAQQRQAAELADLARAFRRSAEAMAAERRRIAALAEGGAVETESKLLNCVPPAVCPLDGSGAGSGGGKTAHGSRLADPAAAPNPSSAGRGGRP